MISSSPWTKRMAAALWLALALMFAVGEAHARQDGQGPKPVKYVFFFIGDGMAITQRTAAEYTLAARQGLDKPGVVKLNMSTLPVQGATTTYSLNSIITDSGAAGTALACGVKSYNGAIGVDGAKAPVKNMAEMAKERGMKVGIVSTVSLDHATPASFYAHQPTRNNYYEIAMEAAKSGFNYFAGGGFKDPEGKKSKQPGDKPGVLQTFKAQGYALAGTRADVLALKKGQDKVLAMNPVLDSNMAMPYAIDADPAAEVSLAQFTAKGIELLDNPKGFFMMVEGGKLDWACHANDAGAAISDTLALDEAIGEAMAFAKKHPGETLIVVTGDHETGGLTLGFAGTKYGNYYQYLKNQKMSFLAFTDKLKAYRKSKTPETAALEDVLPMIEEAFGLKAPNESDLAAMAKSPKPDEDNTSPANPFGMYLKAYEMAQVGDAFKRSMAAEPAKNEDDADYLRYGEYDPLTVTLTHILDSKAGMAWTTYAHTGMPVMTSAMGAGAEAFQGYYDNTALARNIIAAIRGVKTVAAN